MAQLTISATTDFRGGATETGIDQIAFTNTVTAAEGTFDATQFGPGLIIDNVGIAGSAGDNYLSVFVAGALNAAFWQFQNWSNSDIVILLGSAGNDDITGSSQSDRFYGKGGLDHLSGGGGSDTFYLEETYLAGSTIDGGPDSGVGDSILVSAAGFVDLTQIALSGIEKLNLSNSVDQTVFLTGAQLAASGLTQFFGGTGHANTVSIAGPSVDMSGILLQLWDLEDLISIQGTSASANTLIGSDRHDFIDGNATAADTITGGFGADDMQGRGGNDIFRFLHGSDIQPGESIDGGAGTDTIRLENALAAFGTFDFTQATVGFVEKLQFAGAASATATFLGSQVGGGGIASVTGSAFADAFETSGSANLGGVVFSSWTDGTDTITLRGSASADSLTGSSHQDILIGDAGNDTLNGGGGADNLTGGDGNDTYLNPTGDIIVETDAAQAGLHDLVRTNVGFSLASVANIEDLTLVGAGNINGLGTNGANIITGNSGNNTLNGGGGNDTLAGLGGADTLNGGSGNDIYVNPESLDIIGEAAGAAGGTHDKIQTLSSFNLNTVSNVEDITLAGGANVNAIGDNLANILTGNTGNNIINGGGGADTITGGAGNDTMNGGAAADLFKFATTNTGADTIAGFETALDHFDLAGGLFSARVEAGGNTTLTHAGGTILVTGVTGLTLTQWKALIVTTGREAPPALHHDAALHTHGDFLFA